MPIDPNHPLHTCALSMLDAVVADFCRFSPGLAREAVAIAISRRAPHLPLQGGATTDRPRYPRANKPAWSVPIQRSKRWPMLPASKDEREARLKKRRALAAACHLPQGFRPEFTTSQMAVMAVVAMATRGHNAVSITVAEIARRSFTSPATVRAAIAIAAELGLVSIGAARCRTGRSLPNRIAIICPVWRSWLSRRWRGGSKILDAKRGQNETRDSAGVWTETDRSLRRQKTRAPSRGSARLCRRQE